MTLTLIGCTTTVFYDLKKRFINKMVFSNCLHSRTAEGKRLKAQLHREKYGSLMEEDTQGEETELTHIEGQINTGRNREEDGGKS